MLWLLWHVKAFSAPDVKDWILKRWRRLGLAMARDDHLSSWWASSPSAPKRHGTITVGVTQWSWLLMLGNRLLRCLLQCILTWYVHDVHPISPNHKPSQIGAYITTVGGQHIQTLQHAPCWTPAPPNLNVSARVLANVMLGGWCFSSIGANELQATLTLNFGGEGVVQDRRGWILRPSTVVPHKAVAEVSKIGSLWERWVVVIHGW